MKKQLLLFVLMLLPMVASADVVEINGIYYNLVKKVKTAEVTINPNHYSGNIVLPEIVNYEGTEYSVTSIGAQAFIENSELKTITISNSVTSIGDIAFYNCRGLTSITIGNGVTSIGNSAFAGCTKLTSVHISDIEAWCNISFNTSDSNPLWSAHHLFLNGEEIKNLIIPNSVTSIGGSAFSGCTSLTSITIPNSVTNIEGGAFANCLSLTSIIIPNGVMTIGDNTFIYCSGLTTITIPNSVTSIGGTAFSGCTSLTSITIPNSVTSIGGWAFSNCQKLTSITIGNGIKTINTKAFANCPELADVYCLAENVPSTNSDAFEDSYIGYASLHVPVTSVNAYKLMKPWNEFKNIIGIEEIASENTINGHEYVDLGLSSGKLWAKTNLGASSETQYGTYVQWSSNDIVTMNWGEDWGTPGYKDYDELINTCKWTWNTKDGVAGYEVKGPSGKSIFFPAAGFNMMGIAPQSVGSGIYYFTKDMSSEASFVYMLSGSSSSVTANVTFNTDYIYAPIRPIVITKTSDIMSFEDEGRSSSLVVYDLNGTKKPQLQKGLNIIRMSNGKAKKVLVK